MTADIAQAEEAATKLLEGDSDKSMQKFQAKNADFFGEYANARSATGHTEISIRYLLRASTKMRRACRKEHAEYTFFDDPSRCEYSCRGGAAFCA
jgi:hypothetical protein